MDEALRILVQLTAGPLGPQQPLKVPEAGAFVCFEGVVRPNEGGRLILALEYEAYEPMTSRELAALAEDVARKYELLGLRVEHSTGRVAVGEVSFRLQVASRHRGPGLRAIEEFIDRLKQQVPLWKTPIHAEGGQGHE